MLAKYIFEEQIGQGSFGTVHKAVDSNGTRFAIKRVYNNDLFIKEKIEE
jgi:serine/threonine protein kinase